MSEVEFLEVIDKHQNIIHKVCMIYTRTNDDHNDLFQEIVFQAWKSVNKFKGDSKITTWLYRVGLYTALTSKRKRKVDLNSYHEELKFDSKPDTAEENISILYKMIDKLKPTDKALTMLYLEEKSYQEIAEIMGITESNVGVKLNRIKKKLKELWN